MDFCIQCKRPAGGKQNAADIMETETNSPKNEDEYMASSDTKLNDKLEVNPSICMLRPKEFRHRIRTYENCIIFSGTS